MPLRLSAEGARLVLEVLILELEVLDLDMFSLLSACCQGHAWCIK